MTQYRCANQNRVAAVREHATINGIDYLEVLDSTAPSAALRQRVLVLHLFKSAALVADNIRIEGGVRVRPIRVEQVAANDKVITIQVSEPGDWSDYTLRLVRARDDASPPADFDPQLVALPFSFKVECPSDLDCATSDECPPDELPAPLIDYLARDYQGFRRLIFDRLSTTIPHWNERNPADMLVALVETLAYAADHLSYMQDLAGTEMYLGTARLRSSVRRHTRLLDYPLHEGANARLWATFEVDADTVLARGLPLLTRLSRVERLLPPSELEAAAAAGAQVFELMADTPVFRANNHMQFYTWGDSNCCLPRGATRATLLDPPDASERLLLRTGDVLIFEQLATAEGPAPQDQRCAVRLTSVLPEARPAVLITEQALTQLEQQDDLSTAQIDALRGIGLANSNEPIASDDFEQAVIAALGAGDARRLKARLRRRLPALYRVPAPVVTDELFSLNLVEIGWHPDDALPFALCLSDTRDGRQFEQLSVALGNVAPADHGRTLPPEPLEPLPPAGPYRPTLQAGPVLFAAPYRSAAPASTFASHPPQETAPAIKLLDSSGGIWRARRDLLASDRFAQEFVLEVEDDGRAALRFGLGDVGRAPEEGLVALYRIGGGVVGNIGADQLYGIASSNLAVRAVRNPLPASGGVAAEPIESARLFAPQAFRRQERAVTPEDYATMAQRYPDVQRATTSRRWTGSWYTQFITVDRRGGRAVDVEFEQELRGFLARFRLAGHDMEVDAPRYVPLDIQLDVCTRPGSFAGSVYAALLRAFSARNLPGGGRGFFHPDNFSFGQSVYLSQIIATAMAQPGVDWVQVKHLRRMGSNDDRALDEGVLRIGRLEIARLDNDPSILENGRILFTVRERREAATL